MEGKQFALCEDLCSKDVKGAEWCGKVFSIDQKWPNSVLHRVRWEEERAVRVPVQPKPPGQLSSPAGAIQASADLSETLPEICRTTNLLFPASCACGTFLSRRATWSP